MPKAPQRSTKAARAVGPVKDSSKTKDPKASHLYTDDNPATTIHGTGFKDEAAALRTLDLIRQRSLTYQFQTVNTMFHRAKHHPAMKKAAEGSGSTGNMRAAMDVFQTWLEETYPAEKETLRVGGGFKPLLSKKCMGRYISLIEDSADVSDDGKIFARTYVRLPKGKRLGNVLVDDTKPAEPDWERKRYQVLDGLVPEGEESEPNWKSSALWTGDSKPSPRHLELIAWAWSPVKESKLP
ncbi:Hypothetical predicted protein [Lecanosticta acicola]|uniref:Uncharacterized protein n=1 Tax=Lecanosticta acicola TaxID=111012 RepID=A0AAI8W160_9PEZI|nr:Hypothetical predicted protein [Lecanosticta acicola]